MDELISLPRQQIFNSALKVSKSRALLKRRFQSLGLKYAADKETRDRLARIEKNISKHIGVFCTSYDVGSLSNIAKQLSELFLLKGELRTIDSYGDIETSYWSVPLGATHDWAQDVLTSDAEEKRIESFKLSFEKSEHRSELISKNGLMLGSYLLPYFIDFTKVASVFIDTPDTVTFKKIQRLKSPVHPETTFNHIVAIEDSPFLSRVKYKLIETIDRLPDQAGLYTSTFNHIIDKALLTQINPGCDHIDSPNVCKEVVSAFADTLLTLPVFNTGINEQYRHWTPWGFNFVEFTRQAAKCEASVYVPECGQLQWKSPEHKQLASHSLINHIIPKQYHWQLGIPTMWRNQYQNHNQRIELIREWGMKNGTG